MQTDVLNQKGGVEVELTADYYWERIIELRGHVRDSEVLAVVLGFLRGAAKDRVRPDPLPPQDAEPPARKQQAHPPSSRPALP